MSKENQNPEEGTEVEETTNEETAEETVENPTESEVDESEEIPKGYVSTEQFNASREEALRLIEENKKAKEELEKFRSEHESGVNYDDNSEEPLYPGFEDLPDDEKENIKNYTDALTKRTLSQIYKDPAIVSAKEQANERNWESAFQEVSKEIPEITNMSSEFKSKYFKKDNVPTNIKEILTQLAKSELYDKAKDFGAIEAEERSKHIDIERAGGGDKTPKATRSQEDWAKLAQANPAKFAKMAKEYNEDVASGKLK